MPDNSGVDQMMRQHGHRKPGGTSDLDGMRVRRADSKMLGEHRRQHDMRRNRAVAAENAIDLGALQPGIGNGELGGLAHKVERRGAFMLAVGGQSDAGDEPHGDTLTILSFRGVRSTSPDSITTTGSMDSG